MCGTEVLVFGGAWQQSVKYRLFCWSNHSNVLLLLTYSYVFFNIREY